jgi:ribosomal protein L1
LKKYNTDIELVQAIEEWEEYMVELLNQGENVIPDAELLAAYLYVTVNQLKRWEAGERGEAFQNIIGAEMNKIAAAKNQLAMRGAIPVVVWATMMNNNHGYVQNSKNEVIVTRKDRPNVDALIASAKLLPD